MDTITIIEIITKLIGATLNMLTEHFTLSSHRTYWVFLLTAIGLAFSVYVGKAGKAWSLRGFVSFAFPKAIWWHKSARVDYVYFAVNAIVVLFVVGPVISLVYPNVMATYFALFEALNLPSFTAAPAGAKITFFIAFVLIGDFMIFFGHWLQHKVPFLWQFHKVHHAAEVLNPMTLYRQHPMDYLVTGALVGIATATLTALFSYVFSSPFSLFTFGALNVVTLSFYLLGYNLRHSHVRMSYGPTADKWLVSPVQHQLHHSCIEKHFDKNMGLIFAIWDRLFKTHYIPEKDEPIEWGLPNHEAKEFSSAYQCYILPFKKAFKTHGIATSVLVAGILGGASLSIAADRYSPPSLHLEDLTWLEVNKALKVGYKRVIIPTGGTEQNGTHVVLGKHNHVMRYTSDRIASQYGDTLVAPVMRYVPEGPTTKKEGHMAYSGTLSIREEVFEMVLEDTANSLFTHGFTDIYIIGDSGQSVDAQQRAVEKIKQSLKPGQSVHHVSDYYTSHGQVEWLKSKGYSKLAIGSHAGIRDTSELLAVSPDSVRRQGLRQTSQGKGANGAYWKATPEIGQTMLDLKVEAALEQMERLNAPRLSGADLK